MKKRTQVYDVMFEMADEAFKDNKVVILDATFVTQALRRQAAEIATKQKLLSSSSRRIARRRSL